MSKNEVFKLMVFFPIVVKITSWVSSPVMRYRRKLQNNIIKTHIYLSDNNSFSFFRTHLKYRSSRYALNPKKVNTTNVPAGATMGDLNKLYPPINDPADKYTRDVWSKGLQY
jgi:hypothetical protein